MNAQNCRPIMLAIAVVAMAIFTFAASANAATLFADNFDRADNTDLNALTNGKSGSLGALDWVEVKSGAEPSILSSTLRLGETGAGGGWSIAYVDHNFTDALITSGGEFTITVDLVGPINSSGGTRFLGFAVGHSKAELNAWSSNNPTGFASDFFFGYDTTSTNEVKTFINGGTQDYQQTTNLDGGATLSVTFSGITDFNSGTSVNYEAFINGGTAVKTGSFTWSGTNENYLTLYSNYTTHQGVLDNFEVSAVPEPSTFALTALGLLGLIGCGRRRKR
jgi:hypothetical protein